jgi:hydroxymethylpyrimidine/phosphomethylpyrimidine kinase
MKISSIKIGMLGRGELVDVVADFLQKLAHSGLDIPVVLDPVLISSSGHPLLDARGTERLRARLLPLVSWVTPNLDELAGLLGRESVEREAIPAAARELQRLAGAGKLNVVVTGGHLAKPDDFLLTAAGAEQWFPGEWVAGPSTHGTGCAFSSALAANLARKISPAEAVAAAKAYVAGAIRHAKPIGRGKGPLEHFWMMEKPGL